MQVVSTLLVASIRMSAYIVQAVKRQTHFILSLSVSGQHKYCFVGDLSHVDFCVLVNNYVDFGWVENGWSISVCVQYHSSSA